MPGLRSQSKKRNCNYSFLFLAREERIRQSRGNLLEDINGMFSFPVNCSVTVIEKDRCQIFDGFQLFSFSFFYYAN